MLLITFAFLPNSEKHKKQKRYYLRSKNILECLHNYIEAKNFLKKKGGEKNGKDIFGNEQ
jgi:hypothetical protein